MRYVLLILVVVLAGGCAKFEAPPALPAADPDREIRALADELRRLMWQAGGVYRELWEAVERASDDINRQRGPLAEVKREWLANLHKAASTAFAAQESLADTVAHNVRAMRMLAGARG